MEHRDYLDEWRDLMSRNPNEVYDGQTWTDFDGEVHFRTVEDRRYSVAGIFAIEGWTIPRDMEDYLP